MRGTKVNLKIVSLTLPATDSHKGVDLLITHDPVAIESPVL